MLKMVASFGYLMLFLSIAASCLATWNRDTCPWNWSGNPLSCDLILCQRTSDCTRDGKIGICCQTSCGGQNCHFQTVRINRHADVCPPLTWNGSSVQLCNPDERKDTCTGDDQCQKNNTKGYCCTTRCGGRDCYFPTAEECPVSWVGEYASICSQDLCNTNNDCIRANGVRGYCCTTRCGGKNCRYPEGPSVLQLAEKIFAPPKKDCPDAAIWSGGNVTACSERQCLSNEECSANGKSGHCCPTKCRGTSCHVKGNQRSIELDCDPDTEICEDEENNTHKRAASESVCPANWTGILGKCARHQCENGSNCTLSEREGFCCPTKCGGFNCYVPSQPNPFTGIVEGFCPNAWKGSNASQCSEHQCNKSSDCSGKDVEGHCCRTACGGSSCHFLPVPLTDDQLSGRVRPIYPQCPSPHSWPGARPSRCSVKQCTRNNQCWSWSDGILGLCCPTRCVGGYSCYDPIRPTSISIVIDSNDGRSSGDADNGTISAACPQNWVGAVGMCGRHRCENETDCSKEKGALQDGHCCPTKCGGNNCFFPAAESNKTKREMQPETPEENKNEMSRQTRMFGQKCPWKWYGQVGKCRQNVCSEGDDCSGFNGRFGLCCRTRCGANNCYYPIFG